MRARTAAAVLTAAALAAGLTAPAHAAPPPIETSRAIAAVSTDVDGTVVIRVKYRDHGYLGVKPVKVCAHDNPDSTSRTIRVTFRYNDWIVANMGEYKQGKAKCKRLPLSKSQRVTNRAWDAWGKAVVWRFGGVDWFSDSFAVEGRMR